jgi:hypothetical protein
MKTTAAERKARREKYEKCSPIDGDVYPYGLRINLDDESMEKLALKSLPKTGGKMILTAEVTVTSTESRDSEEGGKRESMSLQITAMELAPKGSAKDAVDEALKKA